jgi:hypothetical protein
MVYTSTFLGISLKVLLLLVVFSILLDEITVLLMMKSAWLVTLVSLLYFLYNLPSNDGLSQETLRPTKLELLM